jgi:hypothetical protein
MATIQDFLNATISALVSASANAVPPGGAPCHVALVVLSFQSKNYIKRAIYMCPALRHASLLGHVDDTFAATPTATAWSTDDHTC